MFTSMKSLPQQVIIIIFLVLVFVTCRTKKQVKAPVAAVPATDMAKQDVKPVNDSVPNELLDAYKPAQNNRVQTKKVSTQEDYNNALDSLKDMLEGKTSPDFEKAVFLSENPFHHHAYDYATFQNAISEHITIINKMIAANDRSDSMDFDTKVNEQGRFKLADIRYLPKEKKELYRKALSNWAVFKYITDTVFMYGSLFTYYHAPFAYATADPFGMKDWANSQVMNLLFAHEPTGNCFALTAFYKILADRLQADARLCTAPQHIYIQHKDPKGQYYNVELATAGHPADGIIQTLTYTPTDAIMSGIALRDYNTQQSIGLCLVNLAKSYEHTFNTKDDAFLLRCAELALAHDSLNLNALLLKQQVLDARVTNYASKHRISSITQLKKDTAIAAAVLRLEKHTALMYGLGYRQMPIDMQEKILNQYKSESNHWNHQTKNPKPFTDIKVSDPKDQEYWTLTAGMYQEVFEPKKKESYGHFTLNTTTQHISAIDTHTLKGFIIDPVAFAYDFGARMYDARIGRWLSVDAKFFKFDGYSPYAFSLNNPIAYKDDDGEDVWVSIAPTEKNYSGHTTITVTNYKKVFIKVDGQTVERYVKDGYKVYSLTPKTTVAGVTVGGYSVSTEKDAPNPEETSNLIRVNKIEATPANKAGNIEYFSKDQIQTDLNVTEKLNKVVAENKKYDYKSNNCTDFVSQGLEALDSKYKDIAKEVLKHPIIGLKTEVSTPNQLARGLKKSGAEVLKYDEEKVNFNTQDFVNNKENWPNGVH